MIIYAITNTVNDKRYIGMTETALDVRWAAHKKACRHGSDTALHNAMRKHGEGTFQIAEIAALLPEMTRSDMGVVERVVIAQESTLAPSGYNMTTGGDGVPRGFKHSKPSKRAGQPWPESRRSNAEEFRSKLRLGWKNSYARKAAAAALLVERNGSEEQKQKTRDAWKRDPERRLRTAETMRIIGQNNRSTAHG